MKARRVVEVQLYSFFKLGARWRWVVNATHRPLYPRERAQVPIVQEAGWAPGPFWTGAKKSRLHRDSIPGPCSASESLYRLSYPCRLENRKVGSVLGHKKEEESRWWRKLHNEKLHSLHSLPDIINTTKSRKINCEGHAALVWETRNEQKNCSLKTLRVGFDWADL